MAPPWPFGLHGGSLPRIEPSRHWKAAWHPRARVCPNGRAPDPTRRVCPARASRGPPDPARREGKIAACAPDRLFTPKPPGSDGGYKTTRPVPDPHGVWRYSLRHRGHLKSGSGAAVAEKLNALSDPRIWWWRPSGHLSRIFVLSLRCLVCVHVVTGFNGEGVFDGVMRSA